MSDVPRTDAAKRWMSGFADEWVPRYVCEQIERELNEAKSRTALQGMNMACIDDIINGDNRSGMTPDTTLVAQVGKMKRDLNEAVECLIRASNSVEAGLDYYKLTGMAQRWRKAAGRTKENT